MKAQVRGRSPKGEERRRQILDTATKLFAKGGFNTVSLADIAEQVGITQAGLLHHFPSKSDLLMGMLEQRDNLYLANETKRRASGANYFDSFLQALRDNEEHPEMVQLFTILSSESLVEGNPANQWFKQRYQRIVSVATEEIAQIIDTDKLPDGVSVEDIARGVIALADGLRLQWLMDKSSVDRASTIAKFIAMLRPYMREPEG